MQFHEDPDIAPAMRNVRQKNNDFLAQALLKGRDPSGELDWNERYASKFRELYTKDDAFRELVNGDLNDGSLTRIQARLNELG